MGDEYIKREDAIKIINSGISIDTDADKRYVNGLFRAIRPADVAPVRHGKWIAVDYGDFEECVCSICGEANFGENYLIGSEANYCPNCGARMDGGENE